MIGAVKSYNGMMKRCKRWMNKMNDPCSDPFPGLHSFQEKKWVSEKTFPTGTVTFLFTDIMDLFL